MTRSSVVNVEAGRQRVPLHVFAAMAGALRVEPAALFSREMLKADPAGPMVTLPLLEADPPGMRRFVEGALASIGTTVRWAA